MTTDLVYPGKSEGAERPSAVAATDETFKKAPQARSKGHEQHEMEL